MDEKRFSIFSLIKVLKSLPQHFDLDDAVSPFEEKFENYSVNHDLTKEANEMGLKLIAGQIISKALYFKFQDNLV